MKNIHLIKLILIFTIIIAINKGSAQDFYKDFVKYQDARATPRQHVSKSKLHFIHEQFASEYKNLFNEVKRKTGFDMLNYNNLYIFKSQDDYYSGGYSNLIWNDKHSCYYKNPHFSAIYKYDKQPVKIVTDAQEKLLALGPMLKRIIQNADTAKFRKYIYSPETLPYGAIVQFTVATKVKKHWHFFSSKSFGLALPD